MLFVNEQSQPVVLDSRHTPLLCTHFWTLDFQQMDFMLSPIKSLEDQFCETVTIEMGGFSFIAPSNWSILIVDPDTFVLDVVEIRELAKIQYSVLVYDNARCLGEACSYRVIDYNPYNKIANPFLNKHQMLCHPIPFNKWLCIAPNDQTKYIKDASMGDII